MTMDSLLLSEQQVNTIQNLIVEIGKDALIAAIHALGASSSVSCAVGSTTSTQPNDQIPITSFYNSHDSCQNGADDLEVDDDKGIVIKEQEPECPLTNLLKDGKRSEDPVEILTR